MAFLFLKCLRFLSVRSKVRLHEANISSTCTLKIGTIFAKFIHWQSINLAQCRVVTKQNFRKPHTNLVLKSAESWGYFGLETFVANVDTRHFGDFLRYLLTAWPSCWKFYKKVGIRLFVPCLYCGMYWCWCLIRTYHNGFDIALMWCVEGPWPCTLKSSYSFPI